MKVERPLRPAVRRNTFTRWTPRNAIHVIAFATFAFVVLITLVEGLERSRERDREAKPKKPCQHRPVKRRDAASVPNIAPPAVSGAREAPPASDDTPVTPDSIEDSSASWKGSIKVESRTSISVPADADAAIELGVEVRTGKKARSSPSLAP